MRFFISFRDSHILRCIDHPSYTSHFLHTLLTRVVSLAYFTLCTPRLTTPMFRPRWLAEKGRLNEGA